MVTAAWRQPAEPDRQVEGPTSPHQSHEVFGKCRIGSILPEISTETDDLERSATAKPAALHTSPPLCAEARRGADGPVFPQRLVEQERRHELVKIKVVHRHPVG